MEGTAELTGTLMASYKTCLLLTRFSPCLSALLASSPLLSSNRSWCRDGTHDRDRHQGWRDDRMERWETGGSE